MTWPSESSNVLDGAIEDEIRKELDLIETYDDLSNDANEGLSNDASQDSLSLHEDVKYVDDVIYSYASRLEKRASAFEQELLECDDLLTAATDCLKIEALQESLDRPSAHSSNDLHLTSTKMGLSAVDDASESSDDDEDGGGYLAIEWQPTASDIGRKLEVDLNRSPQPVPSVSELALAVTDAGMLSNDYERSHSADTEERLQQLDVKSAEEGGSKSVRRHAPSLATAASRELYRQAVAHKEKEQDELKAKFHALEHQRERERAERVIKLQYDAEAFRQKVMEKEEQLQKELETENAALNAYATELQEHMRKFDSELNQERMELHHAVLAKQARERQARDQAAVTLQAAYRGYRERKTHAAALHERAASRHEEAVAKRVRELEAQRRLEDEAAAAAQRHRLEEEAAEAKRKLEEAEARRRAMEAEAAEARRKAEEAAEAKRKAKEAAEARKRAKEEAAEAKRKEQEAEAQRRAEAAAEAQRKAEAAAEAKRVAKEREAEERRIRKEAERKARRAEKEQLKSPAKDNGPVNSAAEEERMQNADLESCHRDGGATAAAGPIAAAAVQSASSATNATVAQPASVACDEHASATEKHLLNEEVTATRTNDGDAGLAAMHTSRTAGPTITLASSALSRTADASLTAASSKTFNQRPTSAEAVIDAGIFSSGTVETSPILTASAKIVGNASGSAAVELPGSFDHVPPSNFTKVSSTLVSSSSEVTAAAAIIARQHSEKRLAEMQLLKERMEKLQASTAVARSSSSGSRNPAGEPSAAAAIASDVSAIPPHPDRLPFDLNLSLLSSKMEERRLRWMKDCVPWSSIRTEAANRKVPVKSRKPSSKKKSVGATPELLSVGGDLMAAIADGAGSATEKVQAFHVDDLSDCNWYAAWSSCPDLKAVVARRCQLSSLDDLGSDGSVCAAGLLYLNCQTNLIERLPAAANLDRLTVLDLTSNHVTSMAGLEACPSLRYLCLAKNKLTRIAGLANLKALHTFDVSQNQLISTKGVGEAVSLQFLNVSNNHLSTIDDVDRLCLLESMSASGNSIREIPKLQNAVLLRELLLGDNSISSLGSLSHSWLPALKRLALGHNSLSSLVPLHGCPLLRYVDLGHNQLVDLHNVADALKFCINLDELLLDGSPVACRSNYRAQLHGLLPRMKLVDGMTLGETSVGELYPTDFLKACDDRNKQSAELHRQWTEQTRVPTDRKLDSGELLRICSTHCAYFEQSSSHAQDSRIMHEYGELSDVRAPGDRLASATSLAASNAVRLGDAPERGLSCTATTTTSKAGAPSVLVQPSAAEMNPRAADAERVSDRSGDARQCLSDRSGDTTLPSGNVGSSVPGSSPADTSVRASQSRDAVSLLPISGGSDDDSDDGISAVSCANRASGLAAIAVSEAASNSPASGAGSSGSRLRGVRPRESASLATAESKDAFEERLRAALENTSRRLLERSDKLPGAASVPDPIRDSAAVSASAGHSTNSHCSREHGGLDARAVASSRSHNSRVDDSVRSNIRRDQSNAVEDGLQLAATRIQAAWRGYALRKRLNSALRHARADWSDVDDFSDYGEVDLTAFDLEEARLDESWLPSQTPQLPKSYAALPNRFGASAAATADVLTIPSSPAAHEPRPPVQPRHAWRNQSSAGRGNAAAELEMPFGARELGSFSPALSGGHSHRSGFSRKEELLAEEWGFKDHRTAELMVQRAKKLKYDAIKKKKLRMLDPQQKLAFLRRLEESTRPPVVQVPVRKAAAKLEYFEAMEAETRRKQTEKRAEQAVKEQRMYEWVHTQVGDHYDSDESDGASPSAGRRRQGRVIQATAAEGSSGWQHNAGGSQDSLPYMEKRVIQGGRAQLVASPMDLQSVDSREHETPQQYRRTSQTEKDSTQLPPINTNSAQSNNGRKERISFRDNKVDLGPGWGGGRKRNFQR